MRPLIPCSSCARHVRASEAACPFCGGELIVAAARPQPTGRLSRTAALVFGASVAVVGCGDETVISAGSSSSSSGGTTSSGSTSSGATTGGGQGGMGQGGTAQGGMGGQGGDGGSGQGGMGQGGGVAPLYGAAPPPPVE